MSLFIFDFPQFPANWVSKVRHRLCQLLGLLSASSSRRHELVSTRLIDVRGFAAGGKFCGGVHAKRVLFPAILLQLASADLQMIEYK